MVNNITKYAPVAIPTLNRFDHFCKCLESLEKCTLSDKTDVFVALDYPPSEKYFPGWRKIDEYLKVKEKNNCFKSLTVFRRDHNYGISGPKTNASVMRDKIAENYESYIFTEDDNVFAPNALVYFNKGLQKYKNDPRVFQICGYDWGRKKEFPDDINHYLLQSSCAWGVARWFDKYHIYLRDFSGLENVKRIIRDKQIRSRMRNQNPDGLVRFMRMIKTNHLLGDSCSHNYLVLSNMYCVFPAKSLVRNIGCDGSGQHSSISSNLQSQEISSEYDFEFSEKEYIIKNRKNNSIKNIIKRLYNQFELFLYLNFNYLKK